MAHEEDAAGHEGGRYRLLIARLRLFASAREAAGTARDVIDGATVREVLELATARYGATFAELLPMCRVWVNGDDVDSEHPVTDDDEVAILPARFGRYVMAKKAAPRRAPTKKRKPVWKEVEEREARKVSSRIRRNRKYKRRRLAVVYDVNGPRIRLGIGWFALCLAALVVGVWGVALLYSATAAFAAAQSARELRKAGGRAHRQLASAGAAAIGLCGAISTQLVGVAILGFVAAAVFLASNDAATSKRRNVHPINDASYTVRCGLLPGFAASCVAITARFSLTAVVGLVLIVAAYEVGDYLVGSGARNPFEGPVAGASAIVVTTFAITAIGLKPFLFPGSFALAGLAAVLCPMGQLTASLILPKVDSPASALRRIDSLLLLAPAWALVVGHLV